MSARGLPWYIVLLLSLATWAVVLGVAWLASRFRRRGLTDDQVNARVATARADILEAIPDDGDLAGVVSPGVAAEFTTDVRPYANGVLAVGEDPGGHVSLRDDDTDKEDH